MKKVAKTAKKAPKTFIVDVVLLGGGITPVELEKGQTVEEALELAGYETEGTVVRCKGEQLDMKDMPEDGDRLIISNKTKGAIIKAKK